MAATNRNDAYVPATLSESSPEVLTSHSTIVDPSATSSLTASASASLEAAKDVTFGSLAGICGKFIEYPFDTVKVRLQSHVPSVTSPPYKGPIDCFRRSYRHDGGLASLYRGISAPLFGAAIETSSLFFSYRIAQEVLIRAVPSIQVVDIDSQDSTKVHLPFSALVGCGAASGAFTSLLLTPIELVKCRMQVPSMSTSLGYKAPTPLSLIVSIFRHEGLLGFWHGQLGTLIRETGGSAAWFGSYEGVCRAFKTYHKKQHDGRIVEENSQLPIFQQLLAGAAAGVSYNFLFYPADTIKSRMQTEDTTTHSTRSTTKPSPLASSQHQQASSTPSKPVVAAATKQTFASTGRALWREQGLRGFYKGCGITVLRSAPSSAFIFAIYEGLRGTFG